MEEQTIDKVSALTKEDWSKLEKIYSNVVSHKGVFSELAGESVEPDGTIILGYTKTVSFVDQTMRFFYDKNLIIDFDWGNWDRGRAMFKREGENKFDDLSLEDVLKLFTAVIRNDRFNEGAFASLFETGDARRLLKRLLDFKPV